MSEYVQSGDYKAIKVEGVRNNEIDNGSTNRVLPRQLSTGSTRGTQTVGYGNTKIDGSNNRITIAAPDGSSVGMGSIPGTANEYGFFSLDAGGNVVMKIVLGTWYVDDPSQNLNVMQAGVLPDGTVGWAVASEGKNVADGFV